MASIVSIEGNIGSGKSTLIEHLKNNYEKENIIYLEEPVKEWTNIKDKDGTNILVKFYEDQKKYSFAFQMMAYISRLDLLRRTIKENPGAIIITERSLYTDKYVFAKMLYDSNKIEEIEYNIYNKWFSSMVDLAPLDKVIYMKTSADTSFNRILKRSRDGENNIEKDYIEKCNDYHNEMYKKLNDSDNIKKIIIDCTNNIEEENNLLDVWSNEIMDFIK